MKKLLVLVVLLGLANCAPLQTHTEVTQPVNQVLTVGVGEVVYKLNKTRDMPNAYNKKDIFGRQVDAGFAEVRYLGLKNKSTAKFAQREIDVYSDETTMSGMTFFNSNTNSSGNLNGSIVGNNIYATTNEQSNTNGMIMSKGQAHKELLPGFNGQFDFNFKQSKNLERSGVSIEIIEATNSYLKYKIVKTQ